MESFCDNAKGAFYIGQQNLQDEMMNHSTYNSCFFSMVVYAGLIWLTCLSAVFAATSEEVYRFERLWPVLQQPWYFNDSLDIVVDKQNNVYVADTFNYRIRKFTADGHLITQWKNIGDNGLPIEPRKLAIDSQNNLYISYSHVDFIYKFTPNGRLINKFEIKSEISAITIVISSKDIIYMGVRDDDIAIDYVYKFTLDGQLIEKWNTDSLVTEESNGWTTIKGIAIDSKDNVYILKTANYSENIAYSVRHIQKHTADGQFITQWGSYGSGAGQFLGSLDIAIDKDDNVYIADDGNHRIQKFTSKGLLLAQWGDERRASVEEWEETFWSSPVGSLLQIANSFTASGIEGLLPPETENILSMVTGKNSGNLSFASSESFLPSSIAADLQNNIYVIHRLPNNSVQKYTPEGQLLSRWISRGNGDAQFYVPVGIIRDNNGNLYIADGMNHRVLRFTEQGQFLDKWGEPGSKPGQFLFPTGITIDREENIYVVDAGNMRIQKFNVQGEFVTQWGQLDFFGDSGFLAPMGIATDSGNHVYVVDILKYHVKKFNSEGGFIKAFGGRGNGHGTFNVPLAIAIDSSDNVYVSDAHNHNVQKFTADGEFVMEWGGLGNSDGMFNRPSSMATDIKGNVYVFDSENYRIQKFTSDGQFISKQGSMGTNPGQLSQAGALAVTPDGERIYISELGNNRIQIFNATLYDPGKAIIVAGRRSPDDGLWSATQMTANFAYRTLVYQGFTKESIYYLSADTQLDLDNNGKPDDVDAIPDRDNLREAISEWAGDADNLTLYLTDHGGEEEFRLNSKEILSAMELDAWLDELQAGGTGQIKIIYDACESGSFVPRFEPPPGKERIVITSSDAGQNAYFHAQGSLSFSSYFWTHVFNGLDIEQAFSQAKSAVEYMPEVQTPLLDANGNGAANETEDFQRVRGRFIGNGTRISADAPVIEKVSPPQAIENSNTASIWAEVSDDAGIARVWAVVRTP
ncbi:MAG: 6-bladed beta-propeller, partial [Gammaproteobacteria bacterium]|nr:6-bladed beta-propeller [Gammaproteobacteria bacterium]